MRPPLAAFTSIEAMDLPPRKRQLFSVRIGADSASISSRNRGSADVPEQAPFGTIHCAEIALSNVSRNRSTVPLEAFRQPTPSQPGFEAAITPIKTKPHTAAVLLIGRAICMSAHCLMGRVDQICEYGCNLRFLLILKAPEYGRIWFDATPDRVGDCPTCIRPQPSLDQSGEWCIDGYFLRRGAEGSSLSRFELRGESVFSVTGPQP